MNLTKFIHTKKIKQFNSISKTLLTIATCYCNLGIKNKNSINNLIIFGIVNIYLQIILVGVISINLERKC